ncbi:hypothetical protein ZOSMA_107G00560 [Zostera marina]|uniref:FHA domain-containing protein n=1 Tax=Zostera marina TaxID=29655 RepID=A0A0K9Q4E7_ZOSMR|nr:hypothetical protein ZOSMA_107G00560 [Zostera marina]
MQVTTAAASVLVTTGQIQRWQNCSINQRPVVCVNCRSSEERSSRIHLIKFTTGYRPRRDVYSPRSSSTDSSPPLDSSENWLLQPVGDGDSSHIGVEVPLPGSFEIASDVVTVGRLPEQASMVIPVATVSGLHARFEKKKGRLLVTDLNSTNGTFVGKMRLPPGATVEVLAGNSITFGDTNLAMFRVSKVQDSLTNPEIKSVV